MPLPPLSTAVDPQTRRRIVPYEPLLNAVGSYQRTDQNAPTAGNVPAYVGGISSLPDVRPVEARRAEQWPFSTTSDRPAGIDVPTSAAIAQNTNPQSAAREATWNNRAQPPAIGQPYDEVHGDGLQDAFSVGIARQAAERSSDTVGRALSQTPTLFSRTLVMLTSRGRSNRDCRRKTNNRNSKFRRLRPTQGGPRRRLRSALLRSRAQK